MCQMRFGVLEAKELGYTRLVVQYGRGSHRMCDREPPILEVELDTKAMIQMLLTAAHEIPENMVGTCGNKFQSVKFGDPFNEGPLI